MSRISSQMRFDETIYKKTKYIAETEFRSINAQVEYFMKQGVEKYEQEHGTIPVEEKS